MSKEQIENLISQINAELSSCSKNARENKIPDFSILNNYVAEFTNILKNTKNDSAEYSQLITIWSSELKNLIADISAKKEVLQKQLETSNLNQKAFNVYNKLN